MRKLDPVAMASVVAAVNMMVGAPTDAPIGRDINTAEPGTVCAANATRFDEAFFSQPLTAYATGWRDAANLDAALDFFLPPVQTPRKFEFAKATNSEEFLSDGDNDDLRSIGDNFGYVEYTSAKQTSTTQNRGLTIRVDMDAVKEMPNWRQLYTGRLMRRLKRNVLRRGVTLLLAAATNTAKTWDVSAGKDPDQDVLAECIAYADAAGIYPNRVGYGQIGWSKRQLAHRAQTSAGGFASALLTPQSVAEFLGVDQVYVSKERYTSIGAGTMGKVVPDIVIAFTGLGSATPEDPSNIKRFWSATDSGGMFRVYEQIITSKLVDITVEYYDRVIVTSTLGIRKLTIS